MTDSQNHLITPNFGDIICVQDFVHIFVFISAVYPRFDMAVIGIIQCSQAPFEWLLFEAANPVFQAVLSAESIEYVCETNGANWLVLIQWRSVFCDP